MRKSFGPTLVLVTAVATLLTGWVSYAREATATDVVALVSLLWIGGRIAQSALSGEPFLRLEMFSCCRYRTRRHWPISSRRRRVTSAASCARAEMSSLAKMCARCVWTVRCDMYLSLIHI